MTEELWERRYGAPGGRLIAARWPELPGALADPEAEAELDWLIRVVTGMGAGPSPKRGTPRSSNRRS